MDISTEKLIVNVKKHNAQIWDEIAQKMKLRIIGSKYCMFLNYFLL